VPTAFDQIHPAHRYEFDFVADLTESLLNAKDLFTAQARIG
jgi:hypothetical protein